MKILRRAGFNFACQFHINRITVNVNISVIQEFPIETKLVYFFFDRKICPTIVIVTVVNCVEKTLNHFPQFNLSLFNF